MKFRKLKADEIDVRVGTIKKDWFTLLLYKDARVDMAILDEMNILWQRDHKEVKGNMFCGIGVYDEDIKQWVWKWDCGTESFSEKEKGEASDSFKRAGFNWGIGRELYTSPFIFIKSKDLIEENKNGKYQLKKGVYLKVTDIDYKDDKITKLKIQNKDDEIFMWGYNVDEEVKSLKKQPISMERLKDIQRLVKEVGIEQEQFFKHFKIKSYSDINVSNVADIEDKLWEKKRKLDE